MVAHTGDIDGLGLAAIVRDLELYRLFLLERAEALLANTLKACT